MEALVEDESRAKYLCLTCFKRKECENAFILVFKNTSFSDIFASCMGFKLWENADSKNICIECIKMIIEFYTFKNEALKSYNNFKKPQICTPLSDNINLGCNDDNEMDIKDIELLNVDIGNSSELTEPVEIINTEKNGTHREDDCKLDKPDKIIVNMELVRKEISKGNKWHCPYCPLVLTKDNPMSIKNHKYVEKRRRLKIHPCPICNKKFRKHVLKEHILRHGKDKPVVCEICGRGVSSNQSLKRHMMLHKGKQYTCNVCSRGFTENYLLREHMNEHEKLETFLCQTCGISFLTPRKLRMHNYRQHNKRDGSSIQQNSKDYMCDVCGKGFSSVQTLDMHLADHNGSRLFECERCGKKFSHKAKLTTHWWYHTAEFRCLKCFKTYERDDLKVHHCNPLPEDVVFNDFLRNECRKCGEIVKDGNLERHLKKHSSRECTVCGKIVQEAAKFMHHMNLHRLKCTLCNRGFTKKPTYDFHVKNKVCLKMKNQKKE